MEVSVIGRSSTKLKIVATQVYWTIEDLGLTNSKLKLELIAQPGLRKTHGANGLSGRQEDVLGFAIDTHLPIPQIYETVAHEMIHIKQMAKGKLRYEMKGKKEKVIWCGKDMSDMPYYDRPWEIEAFGKQAILSRRFNEALDAWIAEEAKKKNGKRKRKV